MIEVTLTRVYDTYSLGIFVLLATYGTVQVTERRASIRRYIPCSNKNCGRYRGLHLTVRYSKSREQQLSIVLISVHQLLFTYMHNPPPLLLPEFLFLSWWWMMHPASCTGASVIVGLSQDSMISRTQQSLVSLLSTSYSLSSSILLVMDLVLVRKRLGSSGLCGFLCYLSSAPTRQPRFCFLSLCCLFLLFIMTVIHGEHGVLAICVGMSQEWRNSVVTVHSFCSPSFKRSCRL